MGYTTKFRGCVAVEPALTLEHYQALKSLYDPESESPFRTKDCPTGYCQWQPNRQGTALEWDGGEKFYDSVEWMSAIADQLTQRGYTLNGEIEAQGEEVGDHWKLVVRRGVVSEIPL